MSDTRIKIWDLPLRLTHWGLVISIAYGWFAIEILENMQQHFYAGYCTLSLILFRLLWGIAGTKYSRFSSFTFGPSKILSYGKSMFSDSSKKRYLGHNPLGSLSAAAMMLAIFFQAASGMFSSDDYFHGPLSGLLESSEVSRLSELHLLNTNILLSLIVLHIAAILFYQIYKKEKLIWPMLNGGKDVVKEIGDCKEQGFQSSTSV